MYSITARSIFDSPDKVGDLVYSDQTDLDEYKIFNATLTLEVNSAGSLKFTLPKCNACYSTIQHVVTEIVVWRNDSDSMKEVWRGRVLTEDKDFYNSRVLMCEGELAYLNDTIQPPNVYRDETIDDFIHHLLVNHNNSVHENMKFYKGDILVENDDVVYRYTNYDTTMDCFREKLLERYGGIFRVRHASDGKRYIDYWDEPLNESAQEIRFGSNILDISKHFDMSEFATAVIPLGTLPEKDTYNYIFRHSSQAYTDPEFKNPMTTSELFDAFNSRMPLVVNNNEIALPLRYKESDEIGTVTIARKGTNNRATLSKASSKEDYYPVLDEYLTVESVNDGKLDIVSETAVDAYGYICKVVSFDEITTAENLKAAGELYLSSIQFDNMEIEVSALDLHYANPEMRSINILDKVHVISQPHGLDKYFMVTKIDLPLNNPDNAEITLNGSIDGKTPNISAIMSGNIKATKSIIGAKSNKPNQTVNT